MYRLLSFLLAIIYLSADIRSDYYEWIGGEVGQRWDWEETSILPQGTYNITNLPSHRQYAVVLGDGNDTVTIHGGLSGCNQICVYYCNPATSAALGRDVWQFSISLQQWRKLYGGFDLNPWTTLGKGLPAWWGHLGWWANDNREEFMIFGVHFWSFYDRNSNPTKDDCRNDVWAFNVITSGYRLVFPSCNLQSTIDWLSSNEYQVQFEYHPDNCLHWRRLSTGGKMTEDGMLIYGGHTYTRMWYNRNTVTLGDLWEYNITLNQFRMLAPTWNWYSINDQTYPRRNVSDDGGESWYLEPDFGTFYNHTRNMFPATRFEATSWIHQQTRKFYVFGGKAHHYMNSGVSGRNDCNDNVRYYNDLWVFDYDEYSWAWLNGNPPPECANDYICFKAEAAHLGGNQYFLEAGNFSLENNPGAVAAQCSFISTDNPNRLSFFGYQGRMFSYYPSLNMWGVNTLEDVASLDHENGIIGQKFGHKCLGDIDGGVFYTFFGGSSFGYKSSDVWRLVLDNSTTWSCFGKLSSDETVCSAQGECVRNDLCVCYRGIFGQECDDHSCYGISHRKTESVCSGRGNCTDVDSCACNRMNNEWGVECQELFFRAYYSTPTILVVDVEIPRYLIWMFANNFHDCTHFFHPNTTDKMGTTQCFLVFDQTEQFAITIFVYFLLPEENLIENGVMIIPTVHSNSHEHPELVVQCPNVGFFHDLVNDMCCPDSLRIVNSGCNQCDLTHAKCIGCDEDYFFDSYNFRCCPKNLSNGCSECDYEHKTCLRCLEEGFFFDSLNKVCCSNSFSIGCTMCDNAQSKCTGCDGTLYFFDEINFRCCPRTNLSFGCSSCSDEQKSCESCEDGFFFDETNKRCCPSALIEQISRDESH